MKTFEYEGVNIPVNNIAFVGTVKKNRRWFTMDDWGYNIVCDGIFSPLFKTKKEAEASRKDLIKMIEQVK